MYMTKLLLLRPTVILVFTILFFSCKNRQDAIPFPGDLGISQPSTVPLKFTEEIKINWDTAKRGGIQPVTEKLDINALPSVPYDATGFKPFAQPPQTVHFDYNSLESKPFSLEKIPSKPLDLKMSLLSPAVPERAGNFEPEKTRPLSITELGIPQGFNVNSNTAIYTDSKGFIWFGNLNGLTRYDGTNTQNFVPTNNLTHPVIGITEDHQGNIWYIKGNGYLGMIDIKNGLQGKSQKIGMFIRNPDKLLTDSDGNIWLYNSIDSAVSVVNPLTRTYKNIDRSHGLSDSKAFQVFQAADKKIWITTYDHGVDIIDPASGSIKHLGKKDGLSSETQGGIAQDRNGTIWIGSAVGVDAIDVSKGTITNYNQQQGMIPVGNADILVDSKGLIWRATFNGINVLDPVKGTNRTISGDDGLGSTTVIAMAEDSLHRMWIANITNINVIDEHAATVHPFGTTQIISMSDDEAGNLWVATLNGLYIVNPQRNSAHLLDKAHGLTDNYVQSFWKRNGKMVVCTDGGYNIIDPLKNTITKAAKKEGLVSDTIYTAFSDSYGNMWVTTSSAGVDLVDSAHHLTLRADADRGLSDNTITDIKQGKDGLIWLATQRNGVDVVNIANGTVKYLNDQPGLSGSFPRMMQEDEYGRMWIGTNQGIYVADVKNGTLTNISTKEGLSNTVVTSILGYKGNMVVTTGNRVNIINVPPPGDTSQKWNVSLLAKSERLQRTNINSWSTDYVTSEGKFLWGDNGITIINDIKPAVDSVATYVTGLNVMTNPVYFIDKSKLSSVDTLWTSDSTFEKSQNELVDKMFSNEKRLKWDSVNGPYNLPVSFSLPYDDNYLQFHFVRPSLGMADSIYYTYVLEGIDKNWSTPGSNSFTENYLNLPPGPYTFKVSSKNVNGRWSKPASFSFTVAPPWYQTWWAYTLYVLLGIGLLRLYIVYRSRKLKKENKILEEKVKHRTEQLQKSLEDLKATQSQLIQSEKMASLGELTAGIAHEIQNPLNFVNNFSEVNMELTDELKEELNKTKLSPEERLPIEEIANDIKNNQEKISFHGKRADSIVKGMLQHSRSTNGQKEPTNVNALADEYFRLAYHGLRAKDKSFNATMETDFDENVGKINVVAQDIGRVILNLITNAFYAVKAARLKKGSDYDPTVWVSTKKEKGVVLIIVKDNGTGIPENVKDKIFQPFYTTKPTGEGTGLGLSLSYDIIQTHGGKIYVQSKEGEGTEFTIEMPAGT